MEAFWKSTDLKIDNILKKVHNLKFNIFFNRIQQVGDLSLTFVTIIILWKIYILKLPDLLLIQEKKMYAINLIEDHSIVSVQIFFFQFFFMSADISDSFY